jgi:hypothetical protein
MNKNILLIILSVVITFLVFFGKKTIMNDYQEELDKLKIENIKLNNKNDSLFDINVTLDKKIKETMLLLDSTTIELERNKKRIEDLEDGKGKVSDRVDNLDADGVSSELSDYIKRRK